MKDQILHYISMGIAPAKVATIVGCTPAYVSQLLQDPDFRDKLAAAIVDQPKDIQETKLLTKYEAMEHHLLRGMEDALLGADLPAIAMAMRTVAMVQDMKAKRKMPVAPQAGNVMNIQYVNVMLPSQVANAAPVIDMNSNQEILAINQQPLAPMSSTGVKNLFQRLKEKRDQNEFATSEAAPQSSARLAHQA